MLEKENEKIQKTDVRNITRNNFLEFIF